MLSFIKVDIVISSRHLSSHLKYHKDRYLNLFLLECNLDYSKSFEKEHG